MDHKTTKESLYHDITHTCEALPIARYLKNEVKNSLKYFHAYKLGNIKKNLNAFTNYLLFLNEENSSNIQELTTNTNATRMMNNNLSYFYHHENLTSKEQQEITQKIESNSYHVITLIQGIKGLLLLTIDEFCNASPTRMAINTFIREKESNKKQQKKKVK